MPSRSHAMRTLAPFLVVLALSGALAAPAARAAAGLPATRTLPNGLKLIVLEDHTLPLVAVSLWVHAGSKHEIDSSAGYAHYLEHMVQRGAGSRGAFEFQKMAHLQGGALSVRSNYDRTHISLSGVPGALPELIDAAAAMALHATLTDEEINKELATLNQEMRTYYDESSSVAFLETMRATFPGHPYRYPMLGNVKTMAKLKHAPLAGFYSNLYVPNNMALVVAGDLQPEQAESLAVASFGAARSSATLPPGPPAPSTFPGHADKEKRLAIKEPWTCLSFAGPGYRHPDRPAFEVLARALGDLGGYPVSAAMVNDKVGSRAMVTLYGLEDASMLYIGLQPDTSEMSYSAAASALRAIAGVRKEGLARPALEAIVARMLMEERSAAEHIGERAERLGEAAIFGGLRYYWDRPEILRGLTPDDIRRVAAKYLVHDNLTLVLVLPETAAPLKEESKSLFHEWADRLTAAPEGPAGLDGERFPPDDANRLTSDAWGDWKDAARAIAPEIFDLDNGLRVVTQRDARHGLAAASLHLRFGSADDPPGKEGLASVLGRLLNAGIVTAYRDDRRARNARKGPASSPASVEVQVGRDWTEIRLLAAASDLDELLRALAAGLERPPLTAAMFEASRHAALAELRANERDISTVAGDLFHEKVYAGHSYAHPVTGTAAGLAALTLEDLTSRSERLRRPAGTILAVAGDLRAETLRSLTAGLFGAWPEQTSDRIPAPDEQPAEAGEAPVESRRATAHAAAGEYTRQLESSRGYVLLGVPGVAVDDPDFVPLRQLGVALTLRGFEQMIFRSRAAFSITSLPEGLAQGGALATEIITPPSRQDEAVFDLQRLMRALALETVTPQERETIGRVGAGRMAAELQGVLALASHLGYREAAGLGAASYRDALAAAPGPDADRLKAVAARYLKPGAWVVIKVGPPAR